jgi:UDP-2-acetamido-2,6-beta-L-arabino-hexul-4-ose reductase
MEIFDKKKRILVTGAGGFIGKHLVDFFLSNGVTFLKYNSKDSDSKLEEYIEQSDLLVHLAGVNRPENISEFNTVNFGITEKIINLLTKYNKEIPIIFSSSTQIDDNTPYGDSKLKAEKVLLNYQEVTGEKLYILRLPGVFGSGCKPNYNSVVATFCHNISNNLSIVIHDHNTKIKLLYIKDLIININSMIGNLPELINPISLKPVYEISIKDLATKIKYFHEHKDSIVIENSLDKAIYETYISYNKDRLF